LIRCLVSRAAVVILSAVAFLPGAAIGQSWTKYVHRDLQFTINFPEEPQVETAAYVSAQGREVPAHVFLVDSGTAHYRLTVADFSENIELERGAVAHAAEVLMRRGEGDHNRFAYMDGLPGHHLSICEPNGRRLQATIYLYDHRLYIVEGSDIDEAPLPSWFTYSLIITHADGTQLNLDGYNSESFNAFESPH
jgi:hypothetical protein